MRTNILKEQTKYTLHFWNKRYIILCDLFMNLREVLCREVLCMLEGYIIQKNNYLYKFKDMYKYRDIYKEFLISTIKQ